MKLIHADCRDALKLLGDNSVGSVVTDPPYELGFMGKGWDKEGIAYNLDVWRECLRVLKPGGHLLAFGGSRTYHRLASAIEDAGFEIRDQIVWLYGQGFPKSLDVSKAIDKAAGAERKVVGYRSKRGAFGGVAYAQDDWTLNQSNQPLQLPITRGGTDEAKQWEGWGTALKPAHEPIVVARKPLIGTVAENVLQYGTGAINVDGCRVGSESTVRVCKARTNDNGWGMGKNPDVNGSEQGRWPANVIHDGSEEVLERFPQTKSGKPGTIRKGTNDGPAYGAESRKPGTPMTGFGDEGSAARFFYCAKANKKDRSEGNTHPTVKPTELMRYLVRLITPPNGIVLDPFMGSGSTGKACKLEGFEFIGIEKDQDYYEIAVKRCQ